MNDAASIPRLDMAQLRWEAKRCRYYQTLDPYQIIMRLKGAHVSTFPVLSASEGELKLEPRRFNMELPSGDAKAYALARFKKFDPAFLCSRLRADKPSKFSRLHKIVRLSPTSTFRPSPTQQQQDIVDQQPQQWPPKRPATPCGSSRFRSSF